MPLSGSDFSIDQVLEDSSDAGEPAARPSDDEPVEERPPSAARVRLVAMLSTAVVLCLSSLWMVLAVRSLEGERAELRARARVCAVNQEHNP